MNITRNASSISVIKTKILKYLAFRNIPEHLGEPQKTIPPLMAGPLRGGGETFFYFVAI